MLKTERKKISEALRPRKHFPLSLKKNHRLALAPSSSHTGKIPQGISSLFTKFSQQFWGAIMAISLPCCQSLPFVPEHYNDVAAIQQAKTKNDLAEKQSGGVCQIL